MVIAYDAPTLRLADSLHNSNPHLLHGRQSGPQGSAGQAVSRIRPSLLVAILVPVACFMVISLAGFIWWRQYRKHVRRAMSRARLSARSEESRRSEATDHRSGTNRQRSRDMKSSAAPQEDLLLRRHPLATSHDRDMRYHNSDYIRPKAEYNEDPGPSRWRGERLDLDIVTPAPSSPRRQFLSSVGSVIEQYAQLPDGRSSIYPQSSRQEEDAPSRFPATRIGSATSDRDRRDREQLYAPASGESSRAPVSRYWDQHMRRARGDSGSQDYSRATPEARGQRRLGSPAPIAEGGTKASGRGVSLDFLNSVASPPFGGPGLVDRDDIRPGSSVSAEKEPVRNPPPERKNPDVTQEASIYDTIYTVSEAVHEGKAESNENIPEETLMPIPLRIRKSSSCHLLNNPLQEPDTTRSYEDQQPGPRGLHESQSPNQHAEEPRTALNLATIRRALSSSDEQLRISALDVHDDDETRSQQWNPVIPDTRTEGTRRSSRTFRPDETRALVDLERGLEQSPQLEQRTTGPTPHRDGNHDDPESAESVEHSTTGGDTAWNTNAILNWAKRVL